MFLRVRYGLSAADVWGPDALPAWEIDLLLGVVDEPDETDDPEGEPVPAPSRPDPWTSVSKEMLSLG